MSKHPSRQGWSAKTMRKFPCPCLPQATESPTALLSGAGFLRLLRAFGAPAANPAFQALSGWKTGKRKLLFVCAGHVALQCQQPGYADFLKPASDLRTIATSMIGIIWRRRLDGCFQNFGLSCLGFCRSHRRLVGLILKPTGQSFVPIPIRAEVMCVHQV